MVHKKTWTTQQSAEVYGIHEWGAGYFSYNNEGNITATPTINDNQKTLPIIDIINDVYARGMSAPVLIRFEDILEQQIQRLNQAFKQAMQEASYTGQYRGVFPIKVNQQCHVIEEIADVGARFNNGFEAGSKPELLIALSYLTNKNACIICNGYKDAEFIDLGLYAIKMGYSCFFVVESLSELDIIIERSQALNIEPLIGARVKLASIVGGHWNATSGDRSIFGLSIAQLIDMIDTLKSAKLIHCFTLLHYHLGSQIPNILDIRSGILEACHVYCELAKEGAPMGYLDLGGGLAVDYDGSSSNALHSMNYSLKEYCADIIDVVTSTLDPLNIPHPHIVTESGRATIAYSSVLVFNVLDVSTFKPSIHALKYKEQCEHRLIENLEETLNAANTKNLQECYNDATFYRDEIRALFKRGQVSLRTRSYGENIFLKIMQKLLTLGENAIRPFSEFEALKTLMSDIYYCNFSLFQSLPDIWAIDQIFPIAPIHRLNEQPTKRGILADITCDCDGKIDRFSNMQNIQKTLPLHSLNKNEEYFIGCFLVGAYQETLGDLHNLFGDTNVVSVRLQEDGTYIFADEIEGDSIADVLSYVEYQPKNLRELFRKNAENSVREGMISPKERTTIMNAFSQSLNGYTYYEKE